MGCVIYFVCGFNYSVSFSELIFVGDEMCIICGKEDYKILCDKCKEVLKCQTGMEQDQEKEADIQAGEKVDEIKVIVDD